MKIKLSTRSIISIIVIVVVVIFFGISKKSYNDIYNDYFRLNKEQVEVYLDEIVPKCTKIRDCELLPGDILIRRYVTKQTETFDEFLNPYFIHAAVYIGGDYYFEALGLIDKPEDQIQVMRFSSSDWMDEQLNTFVVIRPKNYGDKLDLILDRFINIANDPEYFFGLPKEGKKETTCADVILKELQKEGLIEIPKNEPEIISPDYLFITLLEDRANFEVIGYNLE